MTRTLLVTNDFPPKLGGIQSYLGELWTRLDPTTTAVLTASSDPGATAHDAGLRARGLEIERVASSTLYVPTPQAARAVDAAVARHRPDLILYDPAVPLGVLGVRQGVPYGVIVHGAELTIPARLPGPSRLVRRILRGASVVVAAGAYPEAEARRAARGTALRVLQVPPGVDVREHAPPAEDAREARRTSLGVGSNDLLVVSVGRLVPRKGLDVLIEAVSLWGRRTPRLVLAIAGGGRDTTRLHRLARRRGAEVRFLGRVSEPDKVSLLGAADLFAQPCRSRWLGLEQEGFGIAFLEAAACGVAELAGRSGGSHEAVVDRVTGRVVDRPDRPSAVLDALEELTADPEQLRAMGRAARARTASEFDYDVLAHRLSSGLATVLAEPTTHHGGGPAPR